MRIGFIGLGTMGGAAALNLIRGGHQYGCKRQRVDH